MTSRHVVGRFVSTTSSSELSSGTSRSAARFEAAATLPRAHFRHCASVYSPSPYFFLPYLIHSFSEYGFVGILRCAALRCAALRPNQRKIFTQHYIFNGWTVNVARWPA